MIPNSVTLHPASKTADEWVVWFGGDLMSPTFNCKGAAEIYLEELETGYRLPDPRR